MNDNIFDLDLDKLENGENTSDNLPFAFPTTPKEIIIKVLGVGGGGGNAVNHMYNEGIHDVTFAVCNTDRKALESSPVPCKLQLGAGLGAGNNPDKGREEAEKSIDKIRNLLSDGTKMVFITAGMGGGTGTGASPIVAKVAKDMDILTVGIVTIPFKWEGNMKIDKALDGVEALSKNVDAMLVINNQRLLEIYQGKAMSDAFAISDNTLCNAAKSISEIITMQGQVNMDFEDVKTVLKNGGVAIMSTGEASGENRVTQAIDNALNSPLLNNNDVYRSKKVLLHIIEPGPEGEAPLMVEEMNEIHAFMNKMNNEKLETKFGITYVPSLKDKVKVTILASGFGLTDISDDMTKKVQVNSEEQARQDEINAARRNNIYGSDNKSGYIRRQVNYYVYKDRDLDNDNLISSVVSMPTYKRTKSSLEKLEAVSSGVADNTAAD